MQVDGDLERGSDQVEGTLNGASTNEATSNHLPPKPPLTTIPDEDWIQKLDKTHDIEIRQLRKGSSEWEDVPSKAVAEPFQVPVEVCVRLFLIQGLAKETLEYFSPIGLDFFYGHYSNTLPYGRPMSAKNCFWAKWRRRVVQTRSQWQIEDKIAKGRPYSLDQIVDPKDLGLDHVRFEREQQVHRPLSSLEPSAKPKETMQLTIAECVSGYFHEMDGGGLIGIILFDAPRKVRVVPMRYRPGSKKILSGFHEQPLSEQWLEELISQPWKFPADIVGQGLMECFKSSESSRQRFKDALSDPSNQEGLSQHTQYSVRDSILRFMIRDHSLVMYEVRELLDFIDEYMSNDQFLRASIQHWRDLFGRWRRNTANDLDYIAYVLRILRHEPSHREDTVTTAMRPPPLAEFERLSMDVNMLKDRAGSTFQAIMATMGIVESQKAIVQAETISKLTNLAFFFIPLTLCSTVLGMNIKEWEGKIETWIWITISLVVMLLTYTALYIDEIKLAFSPRAEYLPALIVNDTARSINRFSLLFGYYGRKVLSHRKLLASILLSRRMIVFVSTIAWAVGIWAIREKCPLPDRAQRDAAVAFGIGLPSMSLMWFTISRGNGSYNITDSGAVVCENRAPKLAYILLAFVLAGVGVGMWAVWSYAPLPDPARISIMMGLGVGVPILFTLWMLLILDDERGSLHRPLLWSAALIVILVPSLWGVIKRSSYDLTDSVSISVGLGIGLPCAIPYWYYIRIND